MANFNIPGVYSQIDASAAVQTLSATDNVIGIAATGITGLSNIAYAPTSFTDGKKVYGDTSNIVNLMAIALANGANKFIIVRVADGKERISLRITAPATVSSDVTVTLGGIATTVAVLTGDTAIQVADKIRGKVIAGWTVGGTIGTDTVTFIANVVGVKTASTYSAGTTTAAGTLTRIEQGAAGADYQTALNVLELEEAVSIVITDSTSTLDHALVKTHCLSASDNRRERISFVGYDAGVDIATVISNAVVLNSGKVYVAHPNPLDINGLELSGIYGAAALAGAVAAESDPSLPLTNVPLYGFYGLAAKLKDSEMSALIDGGVIPLQVRNGTISIVRAVSTYTKNASGVTDITWQELTTTTISHYLFKDMRQFLTSRFARAKQNAKTRSSIKTAVISRLKIYQGLEYIENVADTDVSIAINPTMPTRNDVDFKYDVVTPLNVINLTGHLVI